MPRWPARTMIERFWSKVHRTNSCWLWTGLVSKAGYGIFHGPAPIGGRGGIGVASAVLAAFGFAAAVGLTYASLYAWNRWRT